MSGMADGAADCAPPHEASRGGRGLGPPRSVGAACVKRPRRSVSVTGRSAERSIPPASWEVHGVLWALALAAAQAATDRRPEARAVVSAAC